MTPPKQKPDREISAGVIVWRHTQEGPRFLILYYGHNYWNFARGKIEKEERSFQAALRETKEETGLSRRDLHFTDYFKVKENFIFTRRGKKVFKTVILYLARTSKHRIRISTREHQGFGWFTYREALKLFPLERDKNIKQVLKQVADFLETQTKQKKQKKK